jgi:hypothetical protein
MKLFLKLISYFKSAISPMGAKRPMAGTSFSCVSGSLKTALHYSLFFMMLSALFASC